MSSQTQLTAKGVFAVTPTDIRIKINNDFGRYYRWLFHSDQLNQLTLQPPKHGSHSLVISEKIHQKDCSDYLYLNGREVYFDYEIEGNYGGLGKGFLNFWLNIRCKEAEDILREFSIKKQKGFSLLHTTIGNTKNSCKNNN